MISRAMKSHTNEQIVRGRPTLKDINRFRNGSLCKPYERSIYKTHLCYSKGAVDRDYKLDKSIFRSVIVVLDVIMNQIESQNELKNVWATRAERLENLFTNVRMCAYS